MKVNEIKATCRISVDVKGNWYAYEYTEGWQLDKNDKVKDLTAKLWDKVISEVETQVNSTIKQYTEGE